MYSFVSYGYKNQKTNHSRHLFVSGLPDVSYNRGGGGGRRTQRLFTDGWRSGVGSAGRLDGLGHQVRRPATDGRQYRAGGPVIMGCSARTGGRHAAWMWHDGGPVAHGHHHAGRAGRRWREHQWVSTAAPTAAAAAAVADVSAAAASGDVSCGRRDGRLHRAAGGRCRRCSRSRRCRRRRLGMQKVAPGLRCRRRVSVLLVLVLRYAPGQDLRQQFQLYKRQWMD